MADSDFSGATPQATGVQKVGFDPTNEHPEYKARHEGWTTTRDVYLSADGVGRDPTKYIPQRVIGEADESYSERINLAHYSGILGALIDALVGLWARKPPERDDWGEMGSRGQDGRLDPRSLAARIVLDADREGTSWSNHRRASATWMMVYQSMYSLIDTNRPSGPMTVAQSRNLGVRPFVKRISPLNVLDWIEKDGRKIDVVVKEATDPRTSLAAGDGVLLDRYLRLTTTGWTRYSIGRNKNPLVEDSSSYVYYTADGVRRLPLVEKRLPQPRYAAHNLALIVLSIINHESHLDSLVRAGALGQFLAVQGDDEEVRQSIKVGEKVLPYPPTMAKPDFVSYKMESAPHLESRISALGDGFWKAAMYEFSDSPVEKTATEIESQWASGIGAFLSLLSGAMQQSENEEKWLLYQSVNPFSSAMAAQQASGFGTTQFAENFRVEDVIGELTRIRDLLFGMGEGVPMGTELKARVAEEMMRKLDTHSGILAQAADVDVRASIEEAVNMEGQAQERDQRAVDMIMNEPAKPEEA
jgi:hypothetical protein